MNDEDDDDDKADGVSESEFVHNLRMLQHKMPSGGHLPATTEVDLSEVEFAYASTDDYACYGDDAADGSVEYEQMVSGWRGQERTASVAMAPSAPAAIAPQSHTAPYDAEARWVDAQDRRGGEHACGYEAQVRMALLTALQAKKK